MPHRLLLASRLAHALLVSALAAPAALDAQERHTLSGAGTIWNIAGEVRIESSSGRDIEVEVTRGGSQGGRLEIAKSGSELRVTYPDDEIVYRGGTGRRNTSVRVRSDGTFGNQGGWRDSRTVTVRSSGGGLEAHADLVVRVPQGAQLELYLAVGNITATNVNGDLRLDGHSTTMDIRGTSGRLMLDNGTGDIRVENARGDLSVDTGSGDVELVGVSGTGDVNIDSGSGDVTVRGVVASRLLADVGSGDVTLEGVAADDLQLDTGSGRVLVSLDRVPRSTNIDTGSGGITLSLPEAANVDLDIESGSGGITTEFPISMSSMGRRELRGRIGDGGAHLTVSTGSGSVRLQKR